MVLRLFVVRTVKVRLFFYFGLTVNRSHVNSIKIFIGKPEKKTRHFFQASSLIITNILFFAKVYIVVNRLNIF